MNDILIHLADARYHTHEVIQQLDSLYEAVSKSTLDWETVKLNSNDLHEKMQLIDRIFEGVSDSIDAYLKIEDEEEVDDTTVH